MLLLSTLVGCLHLGLRPVDVYDPAVLSRVFGDVEVLAPVAEPGIDEAARGALMTALVARGAMGEGPAVRVTIVEASLEPALRGDAATGALWYRVRLVAHVEEQGRARDFVLQDWVAEDGQVPDRARIFRGLSERLAQQVAGWLVGG